MDLFEQQKILDRMEELKNKWPEPPVKNSDKWWRYRADQSLWWTLHSKINSAKNGNKNTTR